VVIAALLAAAVGAVLLRPGEAHEADISAGSTLALAEPADLIGYARALGPRDWRFPADFGAHPAFQTEWWYYTGSLATAEGRRFGYQFTIFRRAITPTAEESGSEWRSSQIYAAHFTVTDVAGAHFYQAQRISRPGPGLAGVTGEPRFRAWLEDWSVEAQDAAATQFRLRASEGGAKVDLMLQRTKPPALQGDRGLSAKGDLPGEASYYLSLSRLETSGTVTLRDATFTVQGATWMDQEFTSGALSADAQGWDWFGLHLDDGRDLMLAQIRSTTPGAPPVHVLGALIDADGTVRPLGQGDFVLEVTDSWTSPHSGAHYPAGWTIRLAQPASLEIRVTPLLADQELTGGLVVYWEGAVRIEGDATGYGYAELTGYAGAMRGRF